MKVREKGIIFSKVRESQGKSGNFEKKLEKVRESQGKYFHELIPNIVVLNGFFVINSLSLSSIQALPLLSKWPKRLSTASSIFKNQPFGQHLAKKVLKWHKFQK